MIEEKKDIMSYIGNVDAICITTNGVVRKCGRAVMGAGIAKLFKDNYRGIDTVLGNQINIFGNIVQSIWKSKETLIFSFPTKNDWRCNSSIKLIEQSLKQLVKKTAMANSVVLPRPGCSNGKLNWETQVKPLCEKYLDDRFIIVSK